MKFELNTIPFIHLECYYDLMLYSSSSAELLEIKDELDHLFDSGKDFRHYLVSSCAWRCPLKTVATFKGYEDLPEYAKRIFGDHWSYLNIPVFVLSPDETVLHLFSPGSLKKFLRSISAGGSLFMVWDGPHIT